MSSCTLCAHPYLLKLCIYLRKKSRLLILKEHPERRSHVQVHDPQQSDGRCSHARVRCSQSSLHVVYESFYVNPAEEKNILCFTSLTPELSSYRSSAHQNYKKDVSGEYVYKELNYPAKPNSFIALASQLSASAWFFGFFCANAKETT